MMAFEKFVLKQRFCQVVIYWFLGKFLVKNQELS